MSCIFPHPRTLSRTWMSGVVFCRPPDMGWPHCHRGQTVSDTLHGIYFEVKPDRNEMARISLIYLHNMR